MQWIKSRVFECQPERPQDTYSIHVHRLRSDGAICYVTSPGEDRFNQPRKFRMENIESTFRTLLDEKSPWLGITEGVFDADFERNMKKNNGTEIKEEEIGIRKNGDTIGVSDV